ncbi:SDR family oxidoreductase [Plastoroseomonas arctica]|uniref:SDR family oxidoreductase n=1 Tax=Plastoroseomonas arctica TaxID=1509237 RepID=A0AAF1KT25_9PROT|nr:SDR family oxidoreductase [Plastoroseomonas arctica]MBR0655017.1 SDR family oxidoreductase [Plastoroseomonas arctica]
MSQQGSGRVALVTGAGQGIGRACALGLLRHGYAVALAGRKMDTLSETISLAGDAGGNALAVATDVGDPTAVTALFKAIGDRFGRLDLVFNNAGTNAPGTLFEDLSYEKWAEVVQVNLTGTFLIAQAAFRMMKEQSPQGGRIVNNGSISAHAPRPDSAPYTATKHAVTGLTKSISLDGRKYDICCGQIDIGNAATPMTQRMQKGVKQANGEVKVEPTMDVEAVSTTLLYMDSLPKDAHVQFVTVMADKMPFVGRG